MHVTSNKQQAPNNKEQTIFEADNLAKGEIKDE